MPNMDGFELCSKIQKHSSLQKIPVVFITARKDKMNTLKAFDCGAADYIVKPFDPHETWARLDLQLRLRHYQVELERRVEERHVLLNELNHRVKNSLQLLDSILMLRLSGNSPEAVPMVSSVIQGLAAAHEHLQRTEVYQAVDLLHYLQRLTVWLEPLAGTGSTAIRIFVYGDSEITPSAERALVVGLIVNELVMNAIKHAFTGRKEGEIHVQVSAADAQTGKVEVWDNGIGLPPQPAGEPSSTAGIGMELVHELALQLGAELTVSSMEKLGTRTTFMWKVNG
jgi:two-component sensor histidine kinase